MPTASDELRAEFGIDDAPVIDYLRAKGFKLLPSYSWLIPEGVGMTAKDYRAIKFLCDEWDFGAWYWEHEFKEMLEKNQINPDGSHR